MNYILSAKLFSRRFLLAGLAAGVFAVMSDAAFAEKLDEADIRQIYQDAQDAIRNPSKTMQILNHRIDDNFVLIAHASRTLGNAPAQTGDEKMTKKELIENTAQAYNMIKIEDYQQNILDIKISDDKKWGYVSQTTVMRGSVQVTLTTGGKGTSAYTDAEACVDTLALESGELKIVRSECKIQSQLTAPQ